VFVILAQVQVPEERIEAFITASLDDAQHSVADEPGCSRFDVSQDQSDPTKFWLYEVYDDQAAFDHHLTTPHYHRWSSTVRDWFVGTPLVVRADSVYITA
jgi:autoinducer 2-degrading protein